MQREDYPGPERTTAEPQPAAARRLSPSVHAEQLELSPRLSSAGAKNPEPLGRIGANDREPLRTEDSPVAGTSVQAVTGPQPEHSRAAEVPVPEFQKGRGRRKCACGGPCFYCRRPLDGAHDHDHFPIPHRHGGRKTVPACTHCHHVKDRVKIARWSEATMQAVADGTGRWAMLALTAIAGAYRGSDEPPPPLADEGEDVEEHIERVVADCSTAEARIFAAVTFNLALDAEALRVRRENAH